MPVAMDVFEFMSAHDEIEDIFSQGSDSISCPVGRWPFLNISSFCVVWHWHETDSSKLVSSAQLSSELEVEVEVAAARTGAKYLIPYYMLIKRAMSQTVDGRHCGFAEFNLFTYSTCLPAFSSLGFYKADRMADRIYRALHQASFKNLAGRRELRETLFGTLESHRWECRLRSRFAFKPGSTTSC